MDDIIELDFKNTSLRLAMIDAMKFWVIETGIDGFRCDLAFWVELDFWVEAKPRLEEIRQLFWLGEMDALDNPEYLQVFDAAYTWRWMHKAENYYKGQASFDDLLQVLEQYQAAPGLKAWFTSNHDENTWNGTEYEKYGSLAKALAVFSCTWPGIPLLYSGQELPNIKRLQFFEKDVIEWKEKNELHNFYKELLLLRKKSPSLDSDSPLEILHVSSEQQLLVFRRTAEEEEVIVAINFSSSSQAIKLEGLEERRKNPFTQEEVNLSANGISLEPYGFSVWIK